MNRWDLLLFTGTLFTHKQQAIKPLTAVMSAIEQQFNIKFSYAVEEVVYINIENQLLI
jgi:hypothetical protein